MCVYIYVYVMFCTISVLDALLSFYRQLSLKEEDRKLMLQLLTIHTQIQELTGLPFVSPPPSPPPCLRHIPMPHQQQASPFQRGISPQGRVDGMHGGSSTAAIADVDTTHNIESNNPNSNAAVISRNDEKARRDEPCSVPSVIRVHKKIPRSVSREEFSDRQRNVVQNSHKCDQNSQSESKERNLSLNSKSPSPTVSNFRKESVSGGTSASLVECTPSRKLSSHVKPHNPFLRSADRNSNLNSDNHGNQLVGGRFTSCVSTATPPPPSRGLAPLPPPKLPAPCPDHLKDSVVTELLRQQDLQQGRVMDGSKLVTIL